MVAAARRMASLAVLMAGAAVAEPAGPPAGPAPDTATPCDEPGTAANAWIDKVQRGVYQRVCGAGAWFDGLFGTPRYDRDRDETYGRLGLFERYDRRDQFDTRLRLRARVALPVMKERLRLTLNRDSDLTDLDDQQSVADDPIPQSFRSVQDESWLLGLGYRQGSGLESGFDFGAGVRLRTPLDPYLKVTYRKNWVFSPETALRFHETPFWRESRDFGATTQVSLDHLLSPRLLARWDNAGTVAGDTEGLQWGTTAILFQDLRNRSAVSYAALLRGETGSEVPIRNYGVETRYRRQVWRRWLFLELSGSLTWPRESKLERREANPGVGLGFEMYFGPVPDEELR